MNELHERFPRCGPSVSGHSPSLNEAVTVLAALMVTVHVVPETESHPLQPAK